MPGLLMPIGGAEDKGETCRILAHFVEQCGGSAAHIVIIPSASTIPDDMACTYQRLFYRLGVRYVTILHPANRQEANQNVFGKVLYGATGVFITGGDQMRLMSLIKETRLAETLYECFLNGVHIAGTSAGAAVMSQHMIAYGRSGAVSSPDMVKITAGLGLTRTFIIDQHFTQRNRLGRLKAAVALHPDLTGVGIDEDTALIIGPDAELQVIGSGTVTLVNEQDGQFVINTSRMKALS
ncbi:MAG: cyanophycinase [Anaerolineae bacterium]